MGVLKVWFGIVREDMFIGELYILGIFYIL